MYFNIYSTTTKLFIKRC